NSYCPGPGRFGLADCVMVVACCAAVIPKPADSAQALNVSALSMRSNSLRLFIIFVLFCVMPWGLNWLSAKWRRERRRGLAASVRDVEEDGLADADQKTHHQAEQLDHAQVLLRDRE